MQADPHPSELVAVDDELAADVEVERNLFCHHYDSCLSVAVRCGWSDWTCARCELREQTPPPSATRFAQDRHRDD